MTEQNSSPGQPRPHVGVHMQCCNVYIRAYVNHDQSAFVGWCPRCAVQVRVPIVEQGGSRNRIFGTG